MSLRSISNSLLLRVPLNVLVLCKQLHQVHVVLPHDLQPFCGDALGFLVLNLVLSKLSLRVFGRMYATTGCSLNNLRRHSLDFKNSQCLFAISAKNFERGLKVVTKGILLIVFLRFPSHTLFLC